MYWVKKHPSCAHAQSLKAVRRQEVTGSGPRETTSSMEDMCMLIEVQVTRRNNPDGHAHLYIKRKKVQERWHLYRKFRLHQQWRVQDPHMGAWDQNHQAADVGYCWSGALQDDHQQSPHWYSWHQINVVESDKEAEESSTDDDMPNLEAAVVTIARKQNRSVKRTKIVLSFTCHGMGFCTPFLEKFATFIYHWGSVRFERITFDWLTNLVSCDLRVCTVGVLSGHTRVLLTPRWSSSSTRTRVFVRHAEDVVQVHSDSNVSASSSTEPSGHHWTEVD